MAFKIYGNQEPTKLIGEMIRKGKEPHSIMIHGEKGTGKKTLAKYIAAAMMCESHSGQPCGHCKSCMMLADGNHPDYIEVKANANGNYIIDESIRPIVYDSTIKPTEGNIKVYVIPDLDMSVNTVIQVQNILLKVIEEPPAHAVIIITAKSRESFLPTIISRVIAFGMVRVKNEECAEFLRENFPDKTENEITQAVIAGGGNIGRSKMYISGGQYFSAVENARRIAENTAGSNEYEILKVLTECAGKKALFRESLVLFSEIVRDSCISRLGAQHFISCDKELAQKLSNKLSTKRAVKLYELLCEYIKRIDSNCNLTLTANSLASHLGGGHFSVHG